MLVVSTETNRPDVLEDSQKDALAQIDLINNIDSTNEAFKVVKDIATKQAEEQRDKIIGFLGKDVVDGFKTRMCVNIDITEAENEFSVRDVRAIRNPETHQ